MVYVTSPTVCGRVEVNSEFKVSLDTIVLAVQRFDYLPSHTINLKLELIEPIAELIVERRDPGQMFWDNLVERKKFHFKSVSI